MTNMTKYKKNRHFALAVYAVVLLFLYFIQTSPYMAFGINVGPNLILAFVIVSAMYEDYFHGALIGLFGGLLLDTISVNGSGVHALLFMLTGFACAVLTSRIFQNNFASFLTISAPLLIIHQFVDILTKGALSGGVFTLFFSHYIFVALYTFFAAFIFYSLFRARALRAEAAKKPIGIVPKIKRRKKRSIIRAKKKQED